MMSEKRFFVKKIDDDFCIINHSDDNNVVIYCDSERAIQECCDLLNELAEENEQLRKELNDFKPIMFKNMQKGTIILYSKGGIDE